MRAAKRKCGPATSGVVTRDAAGGKRITHAHLVLPCSSHRARQERHYDRGASRERDGEIEVLVEGFDGLEAIQGRMIEWGKRNPQVLRDLPEEALRCFDQQAALIDETRQVLARMREAMKAMHGECADGETTTRAAKKS